MRAGHCRRERDGPSGRRFRVRVRNGGRRSGRRRPAPFDEVVGAEIRVPLDHFDPEVVEEGLAVAGQAEHDREGPVGRCLAEEDDSRIGGDRAAGAELELLTANRVAHDDSARARDAGQRALHQHRDPDQVIGLHPDAGRPDRRDREIEKLRSETVKVLAAAPASPSS